VEDAMPKQVTEADKDAKRAREAQPQPKGGGKGGASNNEKAAQGKKGNGAQRLKQEKR
jgi:hypothetical protein